MNPQEKWDRLMDPQSADDYELSMSLDELRQVPGAIAVVAGWVIAQGGPVECLILNDDWPIRIEVEP